ncbi:hypothetical protein OPV22_018991 [Ensete ventricosum]|uniref:Uncharacterized protein n=1 Tax=Ensete ventricosum TaxID=4639 RepID=A0AAV8PGC9_ENSVE|nr:hypothetical protein OPV22_018991 [Ensete ventricosum]
MEEPHLWQIFAVGMVTHIGAYFFFASGAPAWAPPRRSRSPGAPALALAVAASFGVGLGHGSIFGGRLGHGKALPGAASDRGAASNADGAAEEGSHHGERCHGRIARNAAPMAS